VERRRVVVYLMPALLTFRNHHMVNVLQAVVMEMITLHVEMVVPFRFIVPTNK
jgi:hypothetical protein